MWTGTSHNWMHDRKNEVHALLKRTTSMTQRLPRPQTRINQIGNPQKPTTSILLNMTETTHLRILQNNLHKNKEHTHAILSDPDFENYAIIMLQEQYWATYSKPSNPTHKSWTLIEPTTYEIQSCSAIYVNNNIISPSHIAPIPIPINDITAIIITNPTNKPSLIINVYNAHAHNKDNCADLRDYIERNLDKNNYELIIIDGDFNVHHSLWNPSSHHTHDKETDTLIETVTQLDLNLLLPTGTITYPKAHITIDLVWGNEKATQNLITCTTSHEHDVGSDHLPIQTIISIANINPPSKELSYNYDKTDWELLKLKVSNYLSNLSIPDITQRLDDYTAIIRRLFLPTNESNECWRGASRQYDTKSIRVRLEITKDTFTQYFPHLIVFTMILIYMLLSAQRD